MARISNVQRVDLKVDDLDGSKPLNAQFAAALFTPTQNIHLKTRVGPLSPPMEITQVPLDGMLLIDTIDIGRLRAAAPVVNGWFPGELELSGVFKIPDLKFKGTLQALALTGALEGEQGLLRYGKSFQKPAGTPLKIVTDAEWKGANVVLRRMDTKIHTLEASAKGELNLGERRNINLTIDSKPASFDGWEKIVPALQAYHLGGRFQTHATVSGNMGPGAKPDVRGVLNLTAVSARPPDFPQPIKDLNAAITFNGPRASWKEGSLSLGNSRINRAAKLRASHRFVSSLDYRAPKSGLPIFKQSAKIEKVMSCDAVRSEGQLASGDGGIRYGGTITSGDGTFYRIPYRNLNTTLAFAGKVLTIKSLKADAMSGAIQSQGEYAFIRSRASVFAGVEVSGNRRTAVVWRLEPAVCPGLARTFTWGSDDLGRG